MKRSTTYLLGLAGVTAMVLLHWCTEPEDLDRRPRPPKLNAKQMDANDTQLVNLRKVLSRRDSLGREELTDWDAADRKLASDPEDCEALFMRANLLWSFHFLDYALDDVNRLLKIEPDSYRAYLLRGEIYYDSGDNEQSLADLSKAILISPTGADAYYRRARLYLERGSPGLAVADLLKCKTGKFLPPLLPDRVNACADSTLFYLGRAYEGINETEHALQAYQSYLSFLDQLKPARKIYDDSYKQRDAAKARINYIVPDVLNR